MNTLRSVINGWVAFLSVFVFSFIWVSSSVADIYKYIDSNGILHFTNAPTSSHYKIYIKERPVIPLQVSSTAKFDPIILEASKRHGLSAHLLKAIIKVESDYDPRAVSRRGAKGLMQIMPETIKALNIANVFDPWENIMGGACYFKQLFNRYKGELPLALAAYNAGPGVVDRFGSIPPFQETEAYVEKVIRYYYIFRRS